MSMDNFSDLFPILDRSVFFNHAAVAPISGPAAEALRQYAQHAAGAAYVGSGWYKRATQVKQSAARLIGAHGHEIAFVPNTTTGLAQVANGLMLGEGDRVIITNVEYPANRYPWENLVKRKGIELFEVAQQPDGRIEVDDVIDAITDHTRVVAISHVQYASGHRIDLKAISDVVHQVGGFLCVDAIQSVGVLPVDVQAMGIDFLAADGHKWMLGPEGCGIFYCREELTRQLHPNVVGWMNMENALDYGNYQFELLTDARRFEPGTYNIPGILALGASLDLLLDIGIETIWSRVETLNQHAEQRLIEKNYRIFSPRPRNPRPRKVKQEHSGILTFEPPVEGPSAQQIVASLRKKNIEIALREGRLRISPHFYNTIEQVDRFVDAMSEPA